jgi:CheY-like chemotaxis protein
VNDSSLRILIAEDQLLITLHLCRKLEDFGYMVLEPVATGEEAIQSALAKHPDIVVMEINLAGEMDGFQAAAEIHRRVKIPILFLTGYSDNQTIERAKEFHPAMLVNKPVAVEKLIEAIRQMTVSQQ